MSVQLGAGLPARTKSGDFLEQIAADIQERVLAEMRLALSRIQVQPPVVNVSSAPAQVTVEPAAAPDVTISGLEDLRAEQERTNELLRQVLIQLARPVTRTVERGAGDLITRVTETRG
jgi:hypothetical protein